LEEIVLMRRALSLVLFALVIVGRASFAQDTIPFVPSPMHVVNRMLEVAEIKKGDVLYDMGSGDGRIVIEAAKRFGIKAVGIDLNPDLGQEPATTRQRKA
jgi:cyclopropane fatty-acyl-phospholipid synthase-like methyltransferase